MKRLIIILSIISIATACNQKTEDQKKPEVTNTISQQEKDLMDAITQHPDSLLLKENLIQYYRDNSKYDQAISETQSFIQHDSANDRLWDIKATLYFENSDTVNAIKCFEKAIALNANPTYIMSLGSLYAQTKNPLALSMADALLLAPKAGAQNQALFIKGLYYSYLGDNVKAISFFDNCLALDYTNTLAYREKGICLYNMSKYQDALQVLDKGITVDHSFDEGYFWMGRCYEKLNEKDKAIESYQAALQITNDYPEAKDALSRLGVK